MMRLFGWIWDRGILSTFVSGFFVILPIVATLAIMGWVGGKLVSLLGPGTFIGEALKKAGLQLVAHESVATMAGWILVLVAIWVLGILVKATAKGKIEDSVHDAVEGIPIVSAIYKPIAQVVGMLKTVEKSDMKAMKAVLCSFGETKGGGFLGLLASPETFRMFDQDCRLVYIPTSPVPMSGGLVFVPTKAVQQVDMSIDDVMKMYFSLGVLSSEVVPEQYRVEKKG
jgi:uncharacterized membrane protein